MAEIITERIEQELTHDGVTMVCVSLEYPVVSGLCKKAEKRINRFYKHHAAALLLKIKRRFLPAATLEYAQSLEKSAAFRPYDTSLRYTVTCNEGDVLSIYRDVTVRVGRAKNTERFGDTWNTLSGWPLGIYEFFPPGVKYHKLLVKNAADIAAKQENAGTSRYYDNYKRLIKKHFSPSSYYITENGIAVFYREQAIAPAAEGIPVFLLNIYTESQALAGEAPANF